ncbi:MAG: phosphotransferase [Trueperaceae bacterium]|nr:phosphotransferase [Trueperaceae bacterium]
MNLPAEFIKNVHFYFEEGAIWLEHLPEALKDFEETWNLELLPHFPNLTINYVAPARLADGSEVVFKFGPPSDELASEMRALQVWNGAGAVRLLKADFSRGVMLLEKLEPGKSFWFYKDDVLAATTCANLLLKLWSKKTDLSAFRSLESWTGELANYAASYTVSSSPIPYHFIDKAMQLRKELLQESDVVLLHGDLHHDNMLSSEREPFLAIDPKGVAGPRGYDIGSFFLNPENPEVQNDWKRLTKQRLEIFSEILGFSKDYLASWAYIHCVLSTCWSFDDGEFPQTPLDVASELEAYL